MLRRLNTFVCLHLPSPHQDVAIEVDGSNRFHMGFRGYKNHWLGTAAFCSIVSLGPLLALLYITVLFDVYWDCELSGLDALCFYGSYPLSGSSEVNSVTFMVLWVVTLAVLVVGLIAKDQLRNLCRMPCSSKEAEFVWIEVPVEEKVLMKTVSPLVRYVRALKVHFKKGRNTYQVTVPIKLAQDGTKYYELKARRYNLTTSACRLYRRLTSCLQV